jgi:hypothetical protein
MYLPRPRNVTKHFLIVNRPSIAEDRGLSPTDSVRRLMKGGADRRLQLFGDLVRSFLSASSNPLDLLPSTFPVTVSFVGPSPCIMRGRLCGGQSKESLTWGDSTTSRRRQSSACRRF